MIEQLANTAIGRGVLERPIVAAELLAFDGVARTAVY
jgi:hypothetical protein